MVLIISNETDASTNLVIEWLEFKDVSWVRINTEDIVNINFNINDIYITVNDRSFYFSQIKSFWYRRGFINFDLFEKTFFSSSKEINEFIKIEQQHLKNYFYFLLKQKKHLNGFYDNNINKLIVNYYAVLYKLKTPETYIIDSKVELLKIIESKKIITKTIAGNPHIKFKDKSGMLYTTEIENIDIIPKYFLPSLFQTLVEKKYELRVFFIDCEFYAMAIFSQKDKQTEVDFRNYNYIKPNRTVPYKLPTKIIKKLDALMKKLNLKSGSIDIIVDKQNEYVFLEVNPIGQFGMVSIPCNYNLEDKIVNYFKYEKD